jgi:hypothetical protein
MKEQTNAILLCLFGALLVLVNKPFGELCRRWQVMISGRDYGLRAFRIPVVVIGSLMLLVGISFFVWRGAI